MANRVNEYIGRLRKEGELDSVGSFTINVYAQGTKVERFGNLDEQSFMFRFMQSAVASGADRVDIKQDTHEMYWTFKMPPLVGTQLKDALENIGEPAKELWLDYIVKGLWPIMKKGEFGFYIRLAKESVLWDGKQISIFKENDTVDNIIISIAMRRFTDGPPWPIIGWLLGKIAIWGYRMALHAMNSACPIPLYFNDERLDGLQNFSIGLATFKNHKAGYCDVPEAIPLRISPATKFNGVAQFPPTVGMVWVLTSIETSGSNSRSSSKPEKPVIAIQWIRDGGIDAFEKVDAPDLPKDKILMLYLASDGLPTDLSDQRLVETDYLIRLKQNACSIARQQIISPEI